MQALAVGALAAMRSQEGVFSTRQVSDLLSDLRLPPMSNPSATLGRLRAQQLLMRPAKDTWALTPRGDARLEDEASQVSAHALAASLGAESGVEFGHRHHGVIPPFLGPMGATRGLARLLNGAPFEESVMLITRFPKEPDDRFALLMPEVREAVEKHGLTLLVASDRMVEDTLWSNVVTHMWASKYAIVLMDVADGALNYNVLIEIGGMLMTGRRCAIIKDSSVPGMPTDLVGHIYKDADLDDLAGTSALVHAWVRDDLGLGSCSECPASATA